jgi:hypothetical protein
LANAHTHCAGRHPTVKPPAAPAAANRALGSTAVPQDHKSGPTQHRRTSWPVGSGVRRRHFWPPPSASGTPRPGSIQPKRGRPDPVGGEPSPPPGSPASAPSPNPRAPSPSGRLTTRPSGRLIALCAPTLAAPNHGDIPATELRPARRHP